MYGTGKLRFTWSFECDAEPVDCADIEGDVLEAEFYENDLYGVQEFWSITCDDDSYLSPPLVKQLALGYPVSWGFWVRKKRGELVVASGGASASVVVGDTVERIFVVEARPVGRLDVDWAIADGCPAEGSVVVYSEAPIGTAVEDTFPCTDTRGITGVLPVESYEVTLEVRDAEDNVVLESEPQVVTVTEDIATPVSFSL